ncbi:U-box domain-containing protein 19-like [Mercurialis annua]|uniref:U-box domain-containing protein 19-like n=1 Tax=Mercurialis annua TaxID=3986 RepID=UPI0021609E24|nr:U-box domain-containing protein 19-like [Mercurialis annua]
MIQRFDRTDRRILTFPAVHPCEGISPAILLDSLITLSQNICSYQSNFFPTQKKNAREAIRQIGILRIFFDEIRDRRLILSESVVLSLSELHLTFQKIQFLLQDCTREGASLWILMKSQSVAAQFRALTRSVATALDILPLNAIGVCSEVRELVELVARQARKAKFELDREDEWVSKQVYLILNYFEKGIEPELSVIKQVVDYLEIKRWSVCAKEMKFLEDEISFQCSNCDEREVPFLSGLLGFMSYCRGVIFETLDHQVNDPSDIRCSMETPTCLNPEDFRCPISLELMTDPVTVFTGQTYDRSSIEKWLKAGNLICPKTGEKLRSKELVPNATLRKLIQQFCSDNGISLSKTGNISRNISRTIVPGSSAAGEAMKLLSRFLARRLVFGSCERKNKAAYEIRLLAKSNIFNRACLIEAGTILPLINLLSSSEGSTQENAIGALLKLSKHTTGKAVIVENGGLKPILGILKSGLSFEAKQTAAATIFYLASVKGYRKLIGEMPETVPALVELIKSRTTCGKKNAVAAIFALLLYPANHQRVLSSGTVPLLLDILVSSDKDELVADSLAVLSALAENLDGALAILKTSALSVITRMLQSFPSRSGKEYCVSILVSLSKHGGDQVIEILAMDRVLMSTLYSLLTDGTCHAGSKARNLMKILHKYRETSSSQSMASAPCERPVHVR